MCSFSVPRGADFIRSYVFPEGTDFTGYSAAFKVYASLGGSVLLTVTTTPTANDSQVVFADNVVTVTITPADIATFAVASDPTEPKLLQFDFFLMSAADLVSKIHGGLFKVYPFGSSVSDSSDDITVSLDGEDVAVSIYAGPSYDITADVSAFGASLILAGSAADARSILGAEAPNVAGLTTPVMGVSASIRYKWEEGAWAAENVGGLWGTELVPYGWAFNKQWTLANAPGSGDGPTATLLAVATNAGSPELVCSLQAITGVKANSVEGSGVNFITYCDAGLTNVSLKGLEVDIQPGSGATISEAFGVAINAFSMAVPGPALAINGVFGGYWSTGITMGKLSSIGSALSPISGAPTMGSLWDTGDAVYAIDAGVLQNTHALRFKGTSTNRARILMDASNFWKFIMGSGQLVFRNTGDTSTLLSIDTDGSVNIEGAGVFKKAGTQVVGARKTGWTVATGTATRTTFDTSTVTLAQLAERVKALIDDLHATAGHGLIGS